MISFALALALAGAGSTPSSTEAGSSPHFAVTAQFRPGKTAGTGEVAVTFAPKDPDGKINVTPPPRLKLDEGPKLLAGKVAPKQSGAPGAPQADVGHPRGQRLRPLRAEVPLEDGVASRQEAEVARVVRLHVAEPDPRQHGEAQHGPGGHAVVRRVHPVEMRMGPRARV